MTTSLSHPRAAFGIQFALLARRWRRQLDAHLALTGLTDATWVPLVHLRETGGGLTQKDLATLVGVDGSSLVRVLDILAREGLIERRLDQTDRRARRIFLTEAGQTRVSEILRELEKPETEILSDLSDADITGILAQFAAIDLRLAQLEAARKSKDQP